MKLNLTAVCAIAFTLAACSQPEEPTPVYTTPEYNKFGSPSCPAGTNLDTTEEGQTICNSVKS